MIVSLISESQKATKSKYPAINKKYEWELYLDHTADVQLHSWGDSLEEAFEQCAMATFGYIDTVEVESEGVITQNLFHFLDDWLIKFSADIFFIPREVKVCTFKIRSIGWGEEFSLVKHPQGTEVKAITYSAMQVHDIDKPEIFAIDI
ncbi:protein archease-like [Oncorhynchus clarkii lewisi]|uniref:protein archease-like n=1 Tax=Oncorhynchus clarkii lewisi TaxID=490388 RepID=UPI0039B95064